jgi:hypothetical protein
MKKTVPSIPAIESFLQNWKNNAQTYYNNLAKEYIQNRDAKFEITVDNLKCIYDDFHQRQRLSNDKIKDIVSRYNKNEMPIYEINNVKCSIDNAKFKIWRSKKTKSDIAIVERFIYDSSELEKILNKEVDHKRIKLFETVQKKAGNIVDASAISNGYDGSLNGFIIGEKSKVFVETIYAGGYNVQCLHFRLLIKSVK